MTALHKIKQGLVSLILSTALAAAASAGPKPDALPTLWYDAVGDQLFKVADNRLFKSKTTAIDWQEVDMPQGLNSTGLTSVVTPESGEGILYVAGPGMGVWGSSDHGQSWDNLGDTLPSDAVVALAAHRDQPETLYAVLDQDGLYRSQDAGQNWKKMDGGPVKPIRRLLHSDMEGSMETGWLYAVSDDAVRLSMDCFCGWRLSGGMEADMVYDVTYDRQNPEQVYAATDAGVWISTDGGQQWQLTESDAAPVAIVTIPSMGLVGIDNEGEMLRLEL